ncbi:zinc-ribbon domain-containing protein [Acidiphilium sp. AL]|uniref:Zinc-ribbon domain-containing protein n=2 Tax=Acidiphilium iwatense TaxID=768198 RepID=A0ABS9DVU0_9PROT|nr:zinc-ribbon domain-containing protein [Acidiphilium sp. AL]MCF3946849.1 zinc-ribbon domain-containing protein [Acidiphilium iwatense]MCU4161034.1 zinc-ribbon domain-containing protein [Acidiphilium sp. AL]
MTCPDCAARYEIPPDLAARLPARLRCARCGAEWHQDAPAIQPPEPAVPAETVPENAPEPAAEPAVGLMPAGVVGIPPSPAIGTPPVAVAAVPPEPISPASPVSARRIAVAPAPETVRLLWLASIGVLVVLIALAIGFRGAIIHAWPPSLRLYRALGLAR